MQYYERGTGGRRGRMRRISAAEHLRIPPAEMSLAKAKAALEGLVQRALSGAPIISPREARSRTVNDLLDSYLTDYAARSRSDRQRRVENYRMALKSVRPWFGALAVGALTKPILTDVAARMRAGGLSDGTVASYFLRLKACLHWAYGEGLLPALPSFPKVAQGPARQHVIAPVGFDKLRVALPEHHAEVATALFLTGCRKSEMLELEWPRVDFDRNEIILRELDTKKNEPRRIPLLPAMRTLLLHRRQRAPVGSLRVFTAPDGRPITAATFGDAWRAARHRTGVEGWPHDFRRTAYDRFLTELPFEVAMQLIEHRAAGIARRYTVISAAKLHQAAAQYAASPRGRSEEALVANLRPKFRVVDRT